MLEANNVGNAALLPIPLSAAATTLHVPAGRGAAFAVGAGNHYYLTLRDDSNSVERVKVTARIGDMLTVVRGQDGTVARSWNQGACLKVEWSPAMMCEFVTTCLNQTQTPSGVTAGTYCLSKCTCIDVGSDGRLTKIELGTGC
jgi:hypothetical protein